MWSSIGFGLLLLILAGVMMWRHVVTWRAGREGDDDELQRDYLFRQFRRRMQASAMIGVVGVAVIAGIWITDNVAAAAFWLGMILLVGWIVLLAVADLIATRHHYERLRQRQFQEHMAGHGERQPSGQRDGDGE